MISWVQIQIRRSRPALILPMPSMPRAQQARRTGQRGLDPENIGPVFGLGDRCDPFDREREVPFRQARQGQGALLPLFHVGNLAFIDLQNNTIALERCDLEQGIAAFHRRAQGLAQVALDDDPVERRGQVDTVELLIEEIDLGIESG